MGAIHQVRSIVRTATTVGTSKEAILLLERKVSELANRVTALEQENSALFSQNRQLVMENRALRERRQRTKSKKGELDQKSSNIFKFFFDSPGRFMPSQICQKFHMSVQVGWRYIDLLCEKDFISA